MKHSFLIQLDTDDMEYHAAFDAQKHADALLAAMYKEAKKQNLGVMDIEVNYLGAGISRQHGRNIARKAGITAKAAKAAWEARQDKIWEEIKRRAK